MLGSLRDIDWDTWKPHDVATLLFVVRRGHILLIRKLRGLGAGKINAPGGRLEPGEMPYDAAIRETMEEVGVKPIAPRPRGELRFQFVDGYALHCHVFSADDCEGEAHSTDEAIPQWTPLSEIPYGEMWADDALWLPLMLAGRAPFNGRFVFDAEKMLDHELVAHDPADALFARLRSLGIESHTDSHPPVFTVEHAKAHRTSHHGVHVKNLFLRNKKGRMWLVTTTEDRPLDLKELALELDAGHVSFGSAARLREHLGVEPGSVTPFAALHDEEAKLVTSVLDRDLVTSDAVFCHPLTNDRTTSIRGRDLVRFLEACGHAPEVVDFTSQERSP